MAASSKEQQLSDIAQRMANDLTYDLAKYANLVPGEGNASARVLFIGEAPGADEDRLRRPFIGRSGQLLRANIRRIGWKEEEVYITNIVKHRPPNNRDPFPDEILLNKPFLDEQILTIDPLMIVTLGRYSMHKFLPDVKITQVHGKVYKVTHLKKKRFVVPLYHPAAALRSTALKMSFEADFTKLTKIFAWAEKQLDTIAIEEQVETYLL